MSIENGHCRLCAELKPNSKMTDLKTDEQRHEIGNKLIRINAGISDLTNTNNLPKTVCFVCLNSLERAYDFVLAVEQAQTVLNEILLMQQIKKEEPTFSDKNSDNEYDSFVYEPPEGDKYVDNIVVKLETDREGYKANLHSKGLRPCKAKQKKKLKSNRDIRGLDAIPLSQLKLTWKDYSWKCSYCETQFTNIDELKSHSMQYHESCNAFKCTDCNIRKLRLDSFLLHVKRHRKYLKLSCYLCNTRFSTPHEVNLHKLEHTDSEHVCVGCNTTFQNSDELKRHTQLFNKNRGMNRIPLIQRLTDSLTCVLCKKTFKSKGSLNTHLLTHTDRKRDHTCEKCGKCFYSKQNLAGHMLLHEDSRPYQCQICKFGFKTPSQLRSHVGVHDGHKPYACDQCGKCFRLQKQLNSHLIIHTDSLPYICTYCKKGFRFKTILNQHIRQHTGVKPYSCEQCQRDFTNWPNYNKHMKRRHGMDMAKKKHTPDGVYPINPATGEIIIYPESNNMQEWKKKMMMHRKPGRPKLNFKDEDTKTSLESKEVLVEQKPSSNTVGNEKSN